MSNPTQNTASGTPVAANTASAQAMSEASREWALTVALQKTEWNDLKGITTRLMSLRDKDTGRKFVAVLFASPTDDLEANQEQFTFLVNGIDVDDLVANLKRATDGSSTSGTPKEVVVP